MWMMTVYSQNVLYCVPFGISFRSDGLVVVVELDVELVKNTDWVCTAYRVGTTKPVKTRVTQYTHNHHCHSVSSITSPYNLDCLRFEGLWLFVCGTTSKTFAVWIFLTPFLSLKFAEKMFSFRDSCSEFLEFWFKF